MSASYFVRYEITAQDLGAFLRHYRDRHLPLVASWPGLQRIVLHTATEWHDPFPVNRGHAVLLAQFEFESPEALNAAFASPERAAARRDFQQFPAYEGLVTHQAMLSEEVWRKP